MSYFFIKLAMQGGKKKLKIRDARGVPFMEDSSRDWIVLAKNAGCLIFMLFCSS